MSTITSSALSWHVRSRGNLTCASITARAMAAWTTLVLSRQSMQLTRKMPSWWQMTPAWSTLTEEHSLCDALHVDMELLINICNQLMINSRFFTCPKKSLLRLAITHSHTHTYQPHLMSAIISEMASVSVCTFSNFIPRLRRQKTN